MQWKRIWTAASAAALGLALPALGDDTPAKACTTNTTTTATSAGSTSTVELDSWVVSLARKAYIQSQGKDIPAADLGDPKKIFQDFKTANLTHDGSDAPKGAIIFLPDRLVVSNGNGTVLKSPKEPTAPLKGLGTPLGWAAGAAGSEGAGKGAGEKKPASETGSGSHAAHHSGGSASSGGSQSPSSSGGSGSGNNAVASSGPAPSPSDLRSIMAKALAADGLPASWVDSNGLWQILSHESSDNPNAQNPTSTAYGLFQFLDSTWGTVGGSKTSDPYLQCVYGLKYISQRYGDPDKAWAFWQQHHWY